MILKVGNYKNWAKDLKTWYETQLSVPVNILASKTKDNTNKLFPNNLQLLQQKSY